MSDSQVILKNLKENQIYIYQVGDSNGALSPVLQFKTIPTGNKVLNMIVYGDFGLVNPQILNHLVAESSTFSSDMILHIGDWACKYHTYKF